MLFLESAHRNVLEALTKRKTVWSITEGKREVAGQKKKCPFEKF